MLKFLAINNLLSVSKKNKKKFLLVTNFAIAFIIAAIITSVISIYYENKLTNLRSELVKLNDKQRITQEWLADLPKLDTRNTDYNFLGALSNYADEDFGKIHGPRYNFHKLMWLPETIKLAIVDAKKIGISPNILKGDDLKKYQQNTKLKEFSLNSFDKEIKSTQEYIQSLLENAKYYEFPSRKNIISDVIFFETLEGETNIKIQDEINKLFHINLALNVMYVNANNNLSDKISEVNKNILEATKKSTNTIFYAFLLQIIIFIIIQIFEIRELK